MNTTIAKQLALSFILILCSATAGHAADEFCWKDSHPRGVGTIPTGCGTKDNQSGLCYDKCAQGMTGNGPVCWSSCPAGYTDMGAVCHINLPLTKNPDWVCTHWFPKWMGGKCRWKDSRCPSGYTNVGLFCALDSAGKSAPTGFSGTYLDPMKNSQGRGAGTIPRGCSAGKENNAGLCYDQCPEGMTGVGPVCWSHPPTGWLNCGMGNAKDSTACGKVIFDQVSSVGSMALSLATLGAAGEAAAAERDATKAATTSEEEAQKVTMLTKMKDLRAALNDSKNLKVVELKDATNTVKALKGCIDAGLTEGGLSKDGKTDAATATKMTMISCAGRAAGTQASGTGEKLVAGVIGATATEHKVLTNMLTTLPPESEDSKMTPADYARVAASVAAMADPTGMTGVTAAYSYPKCSEIFKKK